LTFNNLILPEEPRAVIFSWLRHHEKVQIDVLKWMVQNDMPEDLKQKLREIVSLAHQDQDAMFGENTQLKGNGSCSNNEESCLHGRTDR
jgi:hypothetical protein